MALFRLSKLHEKRYNSKITSDQFILAIYIFKKSKKFQIRAVALKMMLCKLHNNPGNNAIFRTWATTG